MFKLYKTGILDTITEMLTYKGHVKIYFVEIFLQVGISN